MTSELLHILSCRDLKLTLRYVLLIVEDLQCDIVVYTFVVLSLIECCCIWQPLLNPNLTTSYYYIVIHWN